MQRRVLALFALVLVATVGTFVWRTLSRGVETAAADERAELATKPEDARRAGAAELARPQAPETRPEPTQPTALLTEKLPDQRTIAAQGGVEFQVDVVWPADVPPDEKATLVVSGRLTTDVVARLELTRGGRHTIYLPKSETKGRVALEARYLYLDEPPRLDPAKRSKELVLEPKVGACIHGRVLLPEGVAEEDRDLTRFRVVCQSVHRGREGFLGGAETRSSSSLIGVDGRYELGGLSPAMQHSVRLALPTLVGDDERFENVAAGQSIEHDIPVKLGASFFGRVADAAGAPVVKAKVTCVVEESTWSHQVDRVTESREDGTFALRGVEPGRLKLHVTAKGFVDHAGELADHLDGEVRRDLAIVMERGNVLAGAVRWPDGRPADGAALRVTDLGRVGDSRFVTFGGDAPDASADAEGAFEISGLGAGPFQVDASLTEVLPGEGRRKVRKPWRATLESVEAGRRDLVLVLEAPRALVGTVRDDLGRPLEKFTVSATPIGADGDSDWQRRVTQGVRDAEGAFRLEKLHPGSWDVSVAAPDHDESDEQRVVVADGEVELAFVCPRAVTLSGIVLDPLGAPLPGANVHVQRRTETNSWSGSSCRSDDQGGFECKRQASGKLSVWAAHASHAESEPLELETAPGDSLAGLTLHMRVGGSVDVEVLRPAGLQRSGDYVNLSPSDGPRNIARHQETDERGHALFENVPPGVYDVHSWRNDGAGNHRGTVEVVEGRTSSVVLGRATGVVIKVSGRVTAGGEPVEDVGVNFARNVPGEEGSQRWTQTDSTGRYEVVLDQPGKWQVHFNGRGGAVSSELDVPNAPTFVHDVALGTAKVAGTVMDSARAPVAGVGVVIAQHGEGGERRHGGWTQTDGHGRFEFEHVSPGRFHVETYAFGDSGKGLAKATSAEFEVAAGGRVDGLELVMTPGARLEVRMVGERGDGRAWVHVLGADGTHLATEHLDADESLATFESLPPARVRVRAQGEGLRAETVDVELAVGSTRSVEVRLVAAASLTVRLVDANGSAVDGLASLEHLASGERAHNRAEARAEHVFADVLPGRHRVFADTPNGAKGELEVDLAPGESKTVELRLAK